MAQKGKKKPSEGEKPRRKSRAGKTTGKAPEKTPNGSGSADWAPGAEIVAGEGERLLDVDPAREIEDRAREFGPSDNPFLPRKEDRLPEENPFIDSPPADEEEEGQPGREKTQPSPGGRKGLLEENLESPGLFHLVDHEDMGKGVQADLDAYAADPGRSGLVEGAQPPAGGSGASGDFFLDPAVRAGQGRASAEDVLRSRGITREGAGANLPGSGFLDALFLDFPFPTQMEAVACHLALDAHLHGGPAEIFHDLVIQLDQTRFRDIHDLKGALRERFAWEASHGRPKGGNHGR
jgi:hypothetical protein